jgi:hypothetical protein
MSPFRRIASLVLLTSLATLFASRAEASESYPKTLERALDTPCPPDCTTCHTRRSGGNLTANTPVGISMRRAGLECCDTGLLLDVVGRLETDGTDSDMDGVSDTEEMRAGTDPNATEGALKCAPPEEDEGCAVGGVSKSTRNDLPWVFGAGLALVAVARRRRHFGVRRSE